MNEKRKWRLIDTKRDEKIEMMTDRKTIGLLHGDKCSILIVYLKRL
jgi:hypothetical protein